jgi:hypothetical protein
MSPILLALFIVADAIAIVFGIVLTYGLFHSYWWRDPTKNVTYHDRNL